MTREEFLKLQALWDAKLKETGFEDVENRESGLLKANEKMKVLQKTVVDDKFSETHYLQRRATHIESTTRYYQIAGQYLHSHKFHRRKEKAVWSLHAQGLTLPEIRRALPYLTKTQVRYAVEKHKRIMLAVEYLNGNDSVPEDDEG